MKAFPLFITVAARPLVRGRLVRGGGGLVEADEGRGVTIRLNPHGLQGGADRPALSAVLVHHDEIGRAHV